MKLPLVAVNCHFNLNAGFSGLKREMDPNENSVSEQPKTLKEFRI